MADTNATHVNRTYRSTVFIMLFEEKENLLELYNVMSGKDYTDPELLEINTLENAVFTDKMRTHAKAMDIETAAERTIEECIRENVLREFLEKHRAEVVKVSIFEYDQEKHLRQEREQAWEEGREAGIAEGKAAGIAEGKAAGIAEGKAAGIAEGGQNKLSEQIQKKLRRGKTIAQIADELEEEQSVIEKLIKSI